MHVSRLFGFLAAVVLTPVAILQTAVGIPSSAADPCPDIEVIFARGTGAAPGLGMFGDQFVDLLRGRVDGRSVGAYGVNYPASFDFKTSAPLGAADAAGRIQWMAANCPDTKLVLGGMSQGAGVIDLVTVSRPVSGYQPIPVPPEAAEKVAAVVVFGNPLRGRKDGGPLNELSTQFGNRTIDLCAGGDPFCSGGLDFPAHMSYGANGMVDLAANFAADRLRGN